MRTLKSYQQAALDSLAGFARAAQLKGRATAFGESVELPYNSGRLDALMP